MTGPATDAGIPAWWAGLGLPGLVDVHTHFMPDRVMAAVWAYFDRAGPMIATRWPITYRLPEPDRVALLRGFGVRLFTAMLYPHKADMAAWLNQWAAGFAAATPDVVHTATFFPEPSAASYVETALDAGAGIFKAHLQVGGYDPRDAHLRPVWGLLAEAGVPVVVHAGSGPTSGPFTGPGPFGEVLERHPRLVVVLAHLGMPEYADFLALAERHPRMCLDTTMAFTDFTEARTPWPRSLDGRLAELGLEGRVLLGTDFPNIPHTYAHQLAAVARVAERLPAGEVWLREVVYGAGARLFGLVNGA